MIIIVNDNSNDSTLTLLKELKNKDGRIKFLSNKKNMGTLYTRTIGTLLAKGKYIFPFDSDDMFLANDVFFTISNIADKGDFDIVVFDFILTDLFPNVYSPQLKFKLYKAERKPNIVLFQPELGYQPTRPTKNNIRNVEILIFARCVKTQIYQKALNKLGKERYSRFMHLVEDIINNYIIFNTAKSMKYVPKLGYIYIQRKESQSHLPLDHAQFLIYRIYLLEVFIEFSQDKFKNKKIIVHLIFFCLDNKLLKYVFEKNKYYYDLFISCLDKALSSRYISNEDKNKIINKVKFIDLIN